jgi:hypothetical protein
MPAAAAHHVHCSLISNHVVEWNSSMACLLQQLIMRTAACSAIIWWN